MLAADLLRDGLDLLFRGLRPFRTTFDDVAGLVGKVVDDFAGVVVAAAQFATHLFAGLGREQKRSQGAGAEADKEESQGKAYATAFGGLIITKMLVIRHSTTSILG